MKVEYFSKLFSEVKKGEIFVGTPNGENLVMKINPCKEEEKNMNAVRLSDGKLFYFKETEKVYPVNCFIMRNA